MTSDLQLMQFVLLGDDPGSTNDHSRHRRLVCLLGDGKKLAIWGEHGHMENIERVLHAAEITDWPAAVL